jgi:dTDP-4-dehydrorhamnose 3,5-epimerase
VCDLIFEPLPITGANAITPEKREDTRGFFTRLFCSSEFSEHGLFSEFRQANASRSNKAGTLRGLHYQLGSAAEVKVVRCTTGAVFDVALDLRPDSPTFGKWHGLELTSDNHVMLYIPRGCAHGFITLSNMSEVHYLVSSPYTPDLERTVRYNDARFGIVWPCDVTEISPKDAGAPDFDPAYHGIEQLRGYL